LDASSKIYTRDFFAIAEAIDTAVEELKSAKCGSITNKRSVGRDRDVEETEVGIEGRRCVCFSVLRRINHLWSDAFPYKIACLYTVFALFFYN
jgi:hypothetical protein